MTKTVIFDLDGTLLDTLDDLADSVNAALRQFGFPGKTREEVRGYVGNGIAKLIERAIPGGIENPDYPEALEAAKMHYALHCKDKTRPYDGIVQMLDTLKEQGYRMAIVSNKFDAAVKELNRMYFQDRILVAVGESGKVRRKPAPDTVYQALRELSVEDGRAVYVGDSHVDIQTAANAKMPCISVTWGFCSRERLLEAGAEPETMVSSPLQIPALLERFFRGA